MVTGNDGFLYRNLEDVKNALVKTDACRELDRLYREFGAQLFEIFLENAVAFHYNTKDDYSIDDILLEFKTSRSGLPFIGNHFMIKIIPQEWVVLTFMIQSIVSVKTGPFEHSRPLNRVRRETEDLLDILRTRLFEATFTNKNIEHFKSNEKDKMYFFLFDDSMNKPSFQGVSEGSISKLYQSETLTDTVSIRCATCGDAVIVAHENAKIDFYFNPDTKRHYCKNCSSSHEGLKKVGYE